MGELKNCPTCNNIFVKTNLRETCEACYKKEEEQFTTVYNYIRKQKNREATLDDVVNDTGVPSEVVTRFIRTGRIKVSQLPNLGYHCAKCSNLIQNGTICDTCKMELKTGWERADNEEKAFIKRKQQELLQTSYLAKNNIKK